MGPELRGGGDDDDQMQHVDAAQLAVGQLRRVSSTAQLLCWQLLASRWAGTSRMALPLMAIDMQPDSPYVGQRWCVMLVPAQ